MSLIINTRSVQPDPPSNVMPVNFAGRPHNTYQEIVSGPIHQNNRLLS